jgi:hypothetical protein
MERLHKSMTHYVKSISKTNVDGEREKTIPITHLGQTMTTHGSDFEPDSTFGNCLIAMGRTQEKLGRYQETYTFASTATWLESLERSLAQMKEYSAARKKLEQRRLAYDAALAKMRKGAKEDYRAEEEARAQRAKYEETSEDVLRRMEDIKEAEADSIADLGAFLDSELEYYDRCRDEVMRLKREWRAASSSSSNNNNHVNPRASRSRSNTAHKYDSRFEIDDLPAAEPSPPRPSIRSTGRVASASSGPYLDAPRNDYNPPSPISPARERPSYGRAAHTFESGSLHRTDTASSSSSNRNRFAPPANDVASYRSNLRPTASRLNTAPGDVFGDTSASDSGSGSGAGYMSPDHFRRDRSVSPATSAGSSVGGSGAGNGCGLVGKRNPPPPPPSRAKKPAPPLPVKSVGSELGPGARY